MEPTNAELPPKDMFTVGITPDIKFVCLNIPADELTPKGATLLFNAEQARHAAGLLLQAAEILENPGSIGH